MSIAGKVVIITGASSGIGAALAKLLYTKGAKVVLAARRLEELLKVAENCGFDTDRILVCRTDVTKRADHEALRDRALEKFGKIDCWINNAGVGYSKRILDITDDDVDLMVSLNTKSVLYGMQTIVPYYKQIGEGQVINVSSLLGRIPVVSFRSMYRLALKYIVLSAVLCNLIS